MGKMGKRSKRKRRKRRKEQKARRALSGHVLGFFRENGKTKPRTAPDKTRATGHMGSQLFYAPTISPVKVEQREELVKKLKREGDVLEVFGGEGHLTKAVYAKRSANVDEVILVDKDQEALEEADKRLKGRVKRRLIVAENKDWLANEMSTEQLRDLKLVDFDAFGSPADQVKLFFDNYEVKKPLLVGLTDGSAIYLGFHRNREGRAWLKEKYGVTMPFGTREEQIRILDRFMRDQGRKHGFTVTPINVAFEEHRTVYRGYKVNPK